MDAQDRSRYKRALKTPWTRKADKAVLPSSFAELPGQVAAAAHSLVRGLDEVSAVGRVAEARCRDRMQRDVVLRCHHGEVGDRLEGAVHGIRGDR